MQRISSQSSFINLLRQLFAAYSVLYAISLIILLSLYTLLKGQIWLVEFTGNFLEWVLMPTLVLFPLLLWRRRWWATALVGINVAAFMVLFGGQFLPNLGIPVAMADSGHMTLTVMTYNTNSENVRLDELIYTLREEGADVVGLQELGTSSAAAIQSKLQDVYPYQVLYGHGTQGVGVISRYPIVNHELVKGETAFPYLVATLDIDGHYLTVISAHPPSPMRSLTRGVYYSRGIDDVPSLVEQAENNGSTLLLCDLNATPHSEEYDLLKDAGLTDSFQEAGWGFGNTFPAEPGRLMPGFPMVRIDYVWHTGDFRTTEVWVGESSSSDHLPVYAELIWQYGL